MSSYSWTLGYGSASTSGGIPATDRRDTSQMLGTDIWHGFSDSGAPEMKLTAAGDYLLVAGRECLKQAVIRRIVTNPGEWSTVPNYGVGALTFVKEKNTASKRAELTSNLRSQIPADPRVESVSAIEVENSDGLLRIALKVKPAKISNEPLVVAEVRVS